MYTSGAAESRPSMAHAVMLGECPYSRAVERKFVRLPAWVIFYRRGRKKHVAMVRDMSRQGIFLNSVGEVDLLPLVLDAAKRFEKPPDNSAMQALLERSHTEPLFV